MRQFYNLLTIAVLLFLGSQSFAQCESIDLTSNGQISLCEGDSLELSVTLVPGAVYKWYVDDVLLPAETNNIYFAHSSGSYKAMVAIDACAAFSNVIIVDFNTRPELSISSQSTVELCPGSDVSLTVNELENLSFQWFKDGVALYGETDPSVVADSTGSYYVQATNGFGCTSTSTSIQVSVISVADISDVTFSICSEENFNFIPENGIHGFVPVGTSYSWVYEDNLNVIGESAYSVPQNSIYGLLWNTNYSNNLVVYHVTPNTLGCAAPPFDLNVEVKKAPRLIVSPSTTICEGGSTQLFAIDSLNSGPLLFIWTNSNTLNSGYINNPIASPLETTIYNVLSVDNVTQCQVNRSVTVGVVSPMALSITSNNDTICLGQQLELSVSGGYNYYWTPANLVMDVFSANTIAYPDSPTNFVVSATDINGCETIGEYFVVVLNYPILNLPNTIEVCKESQVQLPNQPGIVWSGLASSNEFDAVSSGYVVGRLTNSNQCTSSDSIYIQVHPLPTPVIEGPSVVCANSYYSNYVVPSTGNGFVWNISNGELMNGQGLSNANFHWYDDEYAPSNFIAVVEHNWNTGCEGTDTLFVDFSGFAPNPTEVSYLYPNGSTLMAAEHFAFMRWGSTVISTEQDIYESSLIQYCTYPYVDEALRYYWVEVGEDSSCVTRSYLNAPVFETGLIESTSSPFVIFPNPAVDRVAISLPYGRKCNSVSLYDLTGNQIAIPIVFLENNLGMNISELATGFYMVEVELDNGEILKAKILKK